MVVGVMNNKELCLGLAFLFNCVTALFPYFLKMSLQMHPNSANKARGKELGLLGVLLKYNLSVGVILLVAHFFGFKAPIWLLIINLLYLFYSIVPSLLSWKQVIASSNRTA